MHSERNSQKEAVFIVVDIISIMLDRQPEKSKRCSLDVACYFHLLEANIFLKVQFVDANTELDHKYFILCI